jgi:arylsulfatase A-like enzyme
MADDHAAHAVGAYGGKLCKTPNMDKLAKEGMRFTNCFNVNSLCAPSRAALITGRYNHHNGFKWNGNKFNGAQVTFPKLLQKAGYETALVGKWHLRTDPTGFDYYSIIPGQGRFFNCAFKDTKESPDQFKEVKGYLTDVITDKAIKWMKERDQSKPFCLMVHHKAPHAPHHYPDKYKKLYADADLPEPKSFNADYSKRGPALKNSRAQWSKLDNIIPNHFNKKVPQNLKRQTQEYKEWSYQCFFKGYFRLVAALDDNVGRLTDYVDESGLSKNTIVIYTSDNGFFLGDYGLFNKMWMYEESLRIPLLVRYPKETKAGTVNNELVSILDFAPTFLDYASVEIPSELQGMSIRPLLQGKKLKNWRSAHYYRFYEQVEVPAHYGIRTKRYKLLYFDNTDEWEFYDLKNDPTEMKSQYANPEYAGQIATLKKELARLKTQYKVVDVPQNHHTRKKK